MARVAAGAFGFLIFNQTFVLTDTASRLSPLACDDTGD
jgi:hypothetical protein